MRVIPPKVERIVRDVLLRLWQRRETTVAALARSTTASAEEVRDALDLLRQRGCLIEQTPAGVNLVMTGLTCWQDVLEAMAREKGLRIGRHVKVYQRTGSTNDVAWQFRNTAGANGLVVVADEQTAGRGRLGHAWVTKAEQSILLSVLLREDKPAEIDRMTLLAGLAAAQAAERAVLAATGRKLDVQIKWPNDLLVDGRKLAGILVERRRGYMVVGVGMNVAQGNGDFPAEVAARATSLYQSTGAFVDRLIVVAELIQRLDALCGGDVEQDGNHQPWLAEWKSRCGMLGTRVKVRVGNHAISGRVMDVDPLKGLMLRDESGGVQFVSAQTATLADT